MHSKYLTLAAVDQHPSCKNALSELTFTDRLQEIEEEFYPALLLETTYKRSTVFTSAGSHAGKSNKTFASCLCAMYSAAAPLTNLFGAN